MALILPPDVAMRLGDAVCVQLKAWGECPSGAQVLEDGAKIAFGFEIVSDEPKWRKVVELPVGNCQPAHVQAALNAWREKVREELHKGHPSQTVRGAIARFGAETVNKALENVSHG